MPMARQPPGHLLALLELSGEWEGWDDCDSTQPGGAGVGPSTSGKWDSTAILAALQGAISTANPGHKTSTVPPGRVLAQYHLIRRLGGGSEGEVWEAVRASSGLQAVAMKVLHRDLSSDPARRQAFLHAAELSRRVAAADLIPTLESGEACGFLFQTMPLIDGPTLAGAISERREWLARRNGTGISPEGASIRSPTGSWWLDRSRPAYVGMILQALCGVARAVATAHSSGVAHRDIKPANIMLDRRRPGRAFLGDFGSASDLAGAENLTSPSRDGEPGTPPYMSPERLLRRDSDPALGDVFAIGVTMYEALTLSLPRPVPARLPRSCLPGYLAAAPTVPPLSVCPWLPERVAEIVLRAIAWDANARHSSAADLAEDLERVCSAMSDTK